MPTPATNVRLTEQEKLSLEKIRVHYGLPTAAAAFRRSIEIARKFIEAEDMRLQEMSRLSVASETRKAPRKKNPSKALDL